MPGEITLTLGVRPRLLLAAAYAIAFGFDAVGRWLVRRAVVVS